MTCKDRDKLIKHLQAITYDADGEPSKGVIVIVAGESMPFPDVIGSFENEDNVVIEAEVKE